MPFQLINSAFSRKKYIFGATLLVENTVDIKLNTEDLLRWLRYQKGLRQRDVADYAGIYRSTYIHYEEYGKDFYSPKHMERIAQLFEVPVERLLDDYNLFLRNGQGKQIKAIRMKLGLTQREYADRLGISLCNLKQWEQNRKQLFKSTWEKYFK